LAVFVHGQHDDFDFLMDIDHLRWVFDKTVPLLFLPGCSVFNNDFIPKIAVLDDRRN